MSHATDTLGLDGAYTDPAWKDTVRLSSLERDLLRTWWIRRLQFIAHAGAAATVTTQSYSRLEHFLGVLALSSTPGAGIATAGGSLLNNSFHHGVGSFR